MSRNGRAGEDNGLQLWVDSWTATFLMQEDSKCELLYCQHSYLYISLFDLLTGEVPNAKLLIREFSSLHTSTAPYNKRRCHAEQLRVCTSYTHKWLKMIWRHFDLVTGGSVFFTFHSQIVWCKKARECLLVRQQQDYLGTSEQKDAVKLWLVRGIHTLE